MQPSNNDRILHALSLQIVATYHATRQMRDDMDMDTALQMQQELIAAYCNIRRYISKGPDGKRYGAGDAHKMMQGL
jgi:hypothetical protein